MIICSASYSVDTTERLLRNQKRKRKKKMSVKNICNLFAIFDISRNHTYNATEINNKNFSNAKV